MTDQPNPQPRGQRKRKTKKRPYQDQQSIAFSFHQQLEDIVKDLENIDRMIPRETSRYGCLMNSQTQGEEMAIIEARKSDLLGYIQTICRDHIRWSKKLLEKGWTVEQWNKLKGI